MKIDNKIVSLLMISIFLFSLNVSAVKTPQTVTNGNNTNTDSSNQPVQNSSYAGKGDIDPLVDLEVTVTIKEIRALHKIDDIGRSDFFVVVYINGEKFKSKVWWNQNYIKEPWSAILNVPDDQENVSIKIQLWDWNLGLSRICDISDNSATLLSNYDIDLVYNLKTAHWTGDDYNYPYMSWADLSGYGRLNGCDDNSIYQDERDCLIVFDITQNDFDGDTIPYWTEVNRYHTDPQVNDTGRDDDGDGVPIEWEFRWGTFIDYDYHEQTWRFEWIYDPFVWEDHSNLDPDNDGLNNVEEYLTSQWGSDPFIRDIFVELDQMEAGPNGEQASVFPELGKELLRDAFDKYNIYLHLDDGSMGGGESIPFDNETPREELVTLYQNYFIHGDSNNWRKGVFHYGLLVYDATYAGYVFGVDDNYWGAYQISSNRVDKRSHGAGKAIGYASVYMHELGHTLDIRIPGGHDENSGFPWNINWWKWRPYKSCMNYGYTYLLVDYSDGSRGRNDHDDWGTLDLPGFQLDIE
ncbi:MAG: C2 domain-containing protein [Euryarchaeota archaeon]|nr:C2 domain-containing protein [Euryarchaeota archaeon]